MCFWSGMALKLQEIRMQGVAVHRAFLRQIEGDSKALVEKASILMDLIEAKYWRGGAKLVLKKGQHRNRTIKQPDSSAFL